jgi:hypothetical protein
MKNYILCLLFAVLQIMNTACSTLRRYGSSEPSGINNSLADVNLFSFRLSKAGSYGESKTLWDLSADAQSQYIKILNARFQSNDDFMSAMSCRFGEGQITTPVDYVSRDLRMIFSVSRQRNYSERERNDKIKLSPADRIEYLKITLVLPPGCGIHFRGWNMFTTEYGSIDIGDVSFSRSIELSTSGTLSRDRAPTNSETTVTAGSAASRKEGQLVKYRYLKLNGRINDNGIEMEEEGTREIDLTGNIAADLSLGFDPENVVVTSFSGLKDSTGHFARPGRISMSQTEAIIPSRSIKDTAFAILKMDYVFRNVTGGQRTFPEWDDRVKYFTGSSSKTIPLLTRPDFDPGLFCICRRSENGTCEYLSLAKGEKESPGVFRSRGEAEAFLEWISALPVTVAGNTGQIKIGGSGLRIGRLDLTCEVAGRLTDLSVLRY